jgi:hypothetical protein
MKSSLIKSLLMSHEHKNKKQIKVVIFIHLK